VRIRITHQRYPAPRYAAGTEHDVASRIPHGGYTDAACQYVLVDGWTVNGDHAEEIYDRFDRVGEGVLSRPRDPELEPVRDVPARMESFVTKWLANPAVRTIVHRRDADPRVGELEREVEELRRQVQQKETALQELRYGPFFPSFWKGPGHPCPNTGTACDCGCTATCARW
jgi:hypothetical protein